MNPDAEWLLQLAYSAVSVILAIRYFQLWMHTRELKSEENQ